MRNLFLLLLQAHGSSWQHDSDPCATCKCDYGSVVCETTVTCPPLFCTEGRKPFTPEGECCQICGDPVTGTVPRTDDAVSLLKTPNDNSGVTVHREYTESQVEMFCG